MNHCFKRKILKSVPKTREGMIKKISSAPATKLKINLFSFIRKYRIKGAKATYIVNARLKKTAANNIFFFSKNKIAASIKHNAIILFCPLDNSYPMRGNAMRIPNLIFRQPTSREEAGIILNKIFALKKIDKMENKYHASEEGRIFLNTKGAVISLFNRKGYCRMAKPGA